MSSVSAVLIVKNESESIKDCLESLRWVDEIIVLDSGSTDDTCDIARQYTDKVYENTDWQGYGIQRQRAQSYVTKDWVLMVDADERVSDELRDEIKIKIAEDTRNEVYEIPILPWVFGRFIRHGGWYPAHKVRLYAANVAKYGDDRVHEKLSYSKDVQFVKLKGDLLHFTYRDLEHYLVKSARYAKEWSQQRQAKGKTTSLFTGLLHGVACFMKIYIFRAGFLDGKQGFLIAKLSAHSTFVKYADLWIRTKTKSK